MATTSVLKFMQQTAQDLALRQQLEQLLGVGDGDISSATELDPDESIAINQRAPKVIEFAAEKGYQFSTEELLRVVGAFQQYQEGQLSDGDFAQIVGLASEIKLQNQTKNSFQRLAKYLSRTYLGMEFN